MLQLALLAALTNLAIAVVSAQDPAVFNTSTPLSGSLTNCGTSGPLSCSGGDPSQVNLCCYEYPGVSCIRVRYLPYQYLGAAPKTDARFKGLLLQTQVRQGERIESPSK
jgi:hypothetical protein